MYLHQSERQSNLRTNHQFRKSKDRRTALIWSKSKDQRVALIWWYVLLILSQKIVLHSSHQSQKIDMLHWFDEIKKIDVLHWYDEVERSTSCTHLMKVDFLNSSDEIQKINSLHQRPLGDRFISLSNEDYWILSNRNVSEVKFWLRFCIALIKFGFIVNGLGI